MDPNGNRLLVVGAGGHGRVVAELARALGLQVVGFVDADPRRVGTQVDAPGAHVCATQEELLGWIQTRRDLPADADRLVIGIGDNTVRWRLFEQLRDHVGAALVHPGAHVSPSAHIGNGTVIMAGVVVNSGAEVGSAVILNSASVVEHDCWIGDGAHISPGAILAGGCAVGPLSWVGAGAVLIEGRRIGSRTVVGAGAVVVRDVPEGVAVAGVPARPLTRPQTPA